MACLWWTLISVASTACQAQPIVVKNHTQTSSFVDTIFTKPAIGLLNAVKTVAGWLALGLGTFLEFVLKYFASISYMFFVFLAALIAIVVVCNECLCQRYGAERTRYSERQHYIRKQKTASLKAKLKLPKDPSSTSSGTRPDQEDTATSISSHSTIASINQ